MSDSPGARLRLTVFGCSTAAPHEVTAAAGFLVQWGDTNLLLDIGQGVVRKMQTVFDPSDLTAIVIGHMHADHFLDLVSLRYLYPWGEPAPNPLPVHLPPGGRDRLEALAVAVSERPGFFDAAFDAVEYDPATELAVGDLRLRFFRSRHYVPAWGMVVQAPDGARLAYTGDTGPSGAVEDAVRDADLLLVESALRSDRHDDPERGHLTAPEAIALARSAGVGSALLVHFSPERLTELETTCAAAGPWVRPALDGLTITVKPSGRRRQAGGSSPASASVVDPSPEPSRVWAAPGPSRG